MSLPSVSIVMTPFQRTKLLSKTLDSIFRQRYPNLQIIVVEDRPSEASTELLCLKHGIQYAARRSRQEGWMNPAALLNNGIKKATGEILIIQNAECKYETENGIEQLISPIANDPMLSTVAIVQSLDAQDRFIQWFSHPTDQERAGWFSCFCQAIRREHAMAVQGFDEIFNGYGHEDDLWIYRLKKHGISFRHVENVLVSHQWHERYHYTGVEQQNEIIRKTEEAAVESGKPNVANAGRDWGLL